MLNLQSIKKQDIIRLWTHRCKEHRHRYLEHSSCLEKDKPDWNPLKERICTFDIESQGSLTADWGFMSAYCIKALGGKIVCNSITAKEIREGVTQDKRLIQDLCKDLKKFDKIIVYYGKDSHWRHDFPFARTRAEIWGIKDFPKAKELKIVDIYDTMKSKFKFANNRKDYIARQFGIKAGTTPSDPKIWQATGAGKAWAIRYAVARCKEDVKVQEALYLRVRPYKEIVSTT